MTATRRRSASREQKGSAARVLWTDRAVSDLEAIGDYIAQADPRAAEGWIDQLLATAAGAARYPLAGRLVPEIGRNDVREVFKRTYRVVYRVSRGQIEILTIFEGHLLVPGDVDLSTKRR